MIVTPATVVSSLLKLVDVLAFMHESHGLEPDPENCMACLAFDESRALEVLELVGRPWELEPIR